MTAEAPADALRPFLYGNVPMENWAPDIADSTGEPWAAFARARSLYRTDQVAGAIEEWKRVASMPDLESRQTLQAWNFLRGAGVEPPDDQAKLVLGVVAEMPVQTGHDVLAGYRDGSVRYLNYSGKVVVVEDRTIIGVQGPLRAWLAIAQDMVHAIGPWDQPALPALPAGHGRILMLTPSGPHFGQAQADALTGDPFAARFLGAAVGLLQAVLRIAS
jgi:hypothetical protein